MTSFRTFLISLLIIIVNKTSAEKLTFPATFLWSTATSSYQVEGGNAPGDGRGPSVWDIYARIPNKIRDNSTGEVACDSYNLFNVDIENLKWLGVQQYRFSISWSRIFPTGLVNETRNQVGIDYYHKLIDALIQANITPQVTLYHWDLPQSLGDRGGWLNYEIVRWFSDYAQFCFQEYGKQVKHWITLNEPHSQTLLGYCGDTTEHAPGGLQAHCEWSMYLAGHHMLLAHARAFRIYESQFLNDQRGEVGITINTDFYEPMTNSSVEDRAAADRDFQFFFGWYANPILAPTGDYPTAMKERIGNLSRMEGRVSSRLPQFTPAELAEVKGSAHFLGLNYYTSHTSRFLTVADGAPIGQKQYDSGTTNGWGQGWPIIGPTDSWIHAYPDGLRKTLQYIKNNFGNIPIIITENGCMDTPGEDMNDTTRIFYLAGHISAVCRAINEDSVNVIGYTVWSIMDNFEWADGFSTKFGIFRTDFSSPNLTRTPKQSAYWFQKVVKENSVEEIDLPATTTSTLSSPAITSSMLSTTSGVDRLLPWIILSVFYSVLIVVVF